MNDARNTLLDTHRARIEGELRVLRRLVGIADAGELFDLAGDGLCIEALHVALDALLERRRDVDLDEVGADQLTRGRAHRAIRRDRGHEDEHSVALEEMRDERDARDVQLAILARVAEALRQVGAHDVSVERLDLLAVRAQTRRDRFGQRALPGAGEAREPQHRPPFSA